MLGIAHFVIAVYGAPRSRIDVMKGARMPKSYSQDLRERVLAAYDNGLKTMEIACVFKISRSWARRVKQRRSECGETAPRSRGTGARIKVDRARLEALVQQDADATLLELRERLGVACALSTISTVLKGLRLTFKKRRSMRPNRTASMWLKSVKPGVGGVKTSTPGD
jgi:transposase